MKPVPSSPSRAHCFPRVSATFRQGVSRPVTASIVCTPNPTLRRCSLLEVQTVPPHWLLAASIFCLALGPAFLQTLDFVPLSRSSLSSPTNSPTTNLSQQSCFAQRNLFSVAYFYQFSLSLSFSLTKIISSVVLCVQSCRLSDSIGLCSTSNLNPFPLPSDLSICTSISLNFLFGLSFHLCSRETTRLIILTCHRTHLSGQILILFPPTAPAADDCNHGRSDRARDHCSARHL